MAAIFLVLGLRLGRRGANDDQRLRVNQQLLAVAAGCAHSTRQGDQIYAGFRQCVARAAALGLGVNAGHDLNLENLAHFLAIPGVLEVSIGHALVAECIESGMEKVLGRYSEIVSGK